MNVDMNGWMALHSAMQGEPPKKAFTKEILVRVWQFAKPYHRALLGFLPRAWWPPCSPSPPRCWRDGWST